MASYCKAPSRTFSEYLLLPNYTPKDCAASAVSLKTPLVKFEKGAQPSISLNIPLVSAIMQSVSDDRMAIALAKEGGLSFIFASQSIADEAEMVKSVKNYKAGFVTSDSNIKPDQTLADILALKEKTGHSTVAVTDDGSAQGKLEGMVTSKDYRVSRHTQKTKVKEFMTPVEKLTCAREGVDLSQANDIIWEHKLNALPIIDAGGSLKYFVFRKDYDSHKENPLEMLGANKRYTVGAGLNTRDYKERAAALCAAGADVLCLDSSEGFSYWQKAALKHIKSAYGVPVGAGNVVDADGFLFLAKCGADFVKVGIGGGAICITREAKGIGRGQASAVIEVVRARNAYYKKTGVYIPICSDGGIVHDYQITIALAMGADFCMLGRYFARFDESPGKKFMVNGNYMKEYWGEGTQRARNWQRYDTGQADGLSFEEGVDSFVPYAGNLRDNLKISLSKIKSTMVNCGAQNIPELQEKARLTLVSKVSIIEGGYHDVTLKDGNVKTD